MLSTDFLIAAIPLSHRACRPFGLFRAANLPGRYMEFKKEVKGSPVNNGFDVTPGLWLVTPTGVFDLLGTLYEPPLPQLLIRTDALHNHNASTLLQRYAMLHTPTTFKGEAILLT